MSPNEHYWLDVYKQLDRMRYDVRQRLRETYNRLGSMKPGSESLVCIMADAAAEVESYLACVICIKAFAYGRAIDRLIGVPPSRRADASESAEPAAPQPPRDERIQAAEARLHALIGDLCDEPGEAPAVDDDADDDGDPGDWFWQWITMECGDIIRRLTPMMHRLCTEEDPQWTHIGGQDLIEVILGPGVGAAMDLIWSDLAEWGAASSGRSARPAARRTSTGNVVGAVR